MINHILGEFVPNMDVEPIEPGCTCGCMCNTKTAAISTWAFGSDWTFASGN